MSSFGLQVALFVCAHVGVMFDWEGNKQQLLQGHVSYIAVCRIIIEQLHCMSEVSTSWCLAIKGQVS